MDYKSINTAILTSQDVPESIPRDDKFYDYLLDNNVAYYYCKYLSKEKTSMDKRIIKEGEIFNNKFFKTLKFVNKVSKEKNIKFLLFKTYKYIPEIVDGDIDIFVQKRDFYRFLKALENEGFICFENEHLKGFCKKDEYCNIEPRVNAAFHEEVLLNEKNIWEKVERVNVDEIEVLKVTKEIDLFYLLLEVLYRPSYVKLYLFLLCKDNNTTKLYQLSSEKNIHQDLKFLLRSFITGNVESKRFPLFMGDINFMIWWHKRIFSHPQLTLFVKVKHVLFFFYAKYGYFFFNKLVFRHYWPL